jgi:bifunctional NMN adenylyltransferase/nudix hydrolase
MNIEVPEADYGVVIGRFQVHDLHTAHKELIDLVLSRHKQVLIVIGSPRNTGLDKDPLDYRSRHIMMRDTFNSNKLLIQPLLDHNSDSIWSSNLDDLIRVSFPVGSVMIYGGRDSFASSYDGRYQVAEVTTSISFSGTESRHNNASDLIETSEARKGVIHSIHNQFPHGRSTVDVTAYKCVYNDPDQEICDTEILLGRKEGEHKLRMIGGFFDPQEDENLEQTAKREFYEETDKCEIDNLQYVCSKRIDDYRYRASNDKIITSVFVGKFIYGKPVGTDDIIDVKWVPIKELVKYNYNHIIDSHKEIVKSVVEYLEEI